MRTLVGTLVRAAGPPRGVGRPTAAVAPALVVALALAGCGQAAPQAAAPTVTTVPIVRATIAPPPTGPTTPVPPTAVPPTAVPPTAPPAPPNVVQVTVLDNRFEPPFVEVARGTTVRWINRGQDDHDVTSEDLQTIGSPVLKPGQTFEASFAQPGSIPYLCSLHDAMTATLVVR